MKLRIQAALFIVSTLSHADAETLSKDGLVDEWLQLWSACRLAIEYAYPLNASGRTASSVSADPYYDRTRTWSDSISRFIVVEGEWDQRDGTVRRVCNVMISPAADPLTPLELASIVAAYDAEAARLIAVATHVERNPDPLFAIVRGVGQISQNPRDCVTISYLTAEVAGGFFSSGTGERADDACGGAAFLNEHDPDHDM